MGKAPATESTFALRRRWARRSAFVAAGAAMALAMSGTFSTASSAQQETYWNFTNLHTLRCLSGAPSGNVWAENCSGDGFYQQWDFLSNSGEQSRIKNRETGTCLTTGSSSGPDPVWLAPCNEPNQQWHYSDATGRIQSKATGHYLRTSPENYDIYATTLGVVPDNHYRWAGYPI